MRGRFGAEVYFPRYSWSRPAPRRRPRRSRRRR